MYNNSVLNFPSFYYNSSSSPIADSELFCIHTYYKPIGNEKTFTYIDLINQPACSNSNKTTKYIYPTSDPMTGWDFMLWKNSLKCNDTSAPCYEVLDKICIKVDIMDSANGKSYTVLMDSGCYAGGNAGHYVIA